MNIEENDARKIEQEKDLVSDEEIARRMQYYEYQHARAKEFFNLMYQEAKKKIRSIFK